jgi:hypothetical protein
MIPVVGGGLSSWERSRQVQRLGNARSMAHPPRWAGFGWAWAVQGWICRGKTQHTARVLVSGPLGTPLASSHRSPPAMSTSPRHGSPGGVASRRALARSHVFCRGGALRWCRVSCDRAGPGRVPPQGCCVARERDVFALMLRRGYGRRGRGIARACSSSVYGCMLRLC